MRYAPSIARVSGRSQQMPLSLCWALWISLSAALWVVLVYTAMLFGL